MLHSVNSDRIKCLFNPGSSKRVRFGFSCHATGPPAELYSMIHAPSVNTTYSYSPPFDGDNWYTIGAGHNFTVPSIHIPGQVPTVMNILSILFCRNLNGQNECDDVPIRGATRVASAYIDGQMVTTPLRCSCSRVSCASHSTRFVFKPVGRSLMPTFIQVLSLSNSEATSPFVPTKNTR